MSPLRQQMINAMVLRGLAPKTQQTYLHWVSDFAKHYHCSPTQLDASHLEQYLLFLIKHRHLSASSVRVSLNAVHFLYVNVLERPAYQFKIAYPKKPLRIPDLLTREEVQRIIACCRNAKHHAMLSTCYGTGLRVSELVALEVRNIDSACHILHIKQGKGAQDREVPIGDALLQELRRYWCLCRPHQLLFHGSQIDKALSIQSAQRVFKRSKHHAGVIKLGGIHSLRHAYATHQLNAGMPLHRLQRALGHKHIRTTMNYIHWLPHYQDTGNGASDLLAW